MRSLSKTDTTKHNRAAFTLIELLASAVLASLLMVTLFGVLRAATRQERAARETAPGAAQLRMLAAQLRRDFVNAREMRVAPRQVHLSGATAHDRRTLLPNLRPAHVTYVVASVGEQRWLVRKEVAIDRLRPSRPRVDLLWPDVRALEVVALDEPTASAGAAALATGSMPGRLHVTVRGNDGRPLLTQQIFHHTHHQQ